MKKRLITALFIAIIYVGTLLLAFLVHPIFFDILVLLLMIFAGVEVSNAIAKKYSRPINVFIILEIVLGYGAFKFVHSYWGNGSGGITAFFAVIAILFIASIIFNMWSNNHTINNVISTLFVMIYPIALMTYLLGLNYLPNTYRVVAILFTFIATAITDSMAFLVGSTIKGPKLCPNISPKKTISGAIGGLIGGLISGMIVYVFAYFECFGSGMITTHIWSNILHFLAIGLITSIACQLGDLIASYIKRTSEIKDFSNILPGHGGIMDRIDGMILSAVFIYIYFTILVMVL